ncbi:uncharacterized protein LOC132754067 [Ruditapes philippinarum]|uniref:uncharacterized protein LOC132754067 n=1 Tax=Ruditapes philippinarum TaxID=129788 RepID=UPI00295AED17|nr:uncharacterized protein LOC132754067 [Ruditapes philippinarum]
MGSCLVKSKIKKNSVSPSYSEAEIRKRNSRNSPGRKAPDPINPEDMVKQLQEAEIEESKLTKGGVSFTVDFNTGDPSRMPSRLADGLDEAVTPTQNEEEVHYTCR